MNPLYKLYRLDQDGRETHCDKTLREAQSTAESLRSHDEDGQYPQAIHLGCVIAVLQH